MKFVWQMLWSNREEERQLEKDMPIGIRMSQIKLLQGRIFQSILSKHLDMDLNTAQTHILFQLWNEDNITISELSRRTDLAKTTLTSMLDRLEQAGWIKRKNNPDNRREIRIILSDNAVQLEKKCYEAFEEMSKINFRGFSQEEKQELDGYLKRLYQNLTEYEIGEKNESK